MFRPHGILNASPAYICSRCFRRSIQQQKRHIVTTQARTAQAIPNPVDLSTSKKHDDELLRQLFDKSKIFNEYAPTSSLLRGKSGLFQNKLLTSPDGFGTFAHRSIEQAQVLVARISKAANRQELLRVVKDLDRLSDVICQVIDLSSFVRDSHPDSAMVEAADQAHAIMYEYMNVLNVTQGLYQALKKAIEDKEVMALYSSEERMVARILMADFIKSGISLPLASREKFVSLSTEISRLGTRFTSEVEPAVPYVQFDTSQLQGMDPVVVKSLAKRGQVTLSSLDLPMQHVLQSADDANVRFQAYLANNTASKSQVSILDQMLRKRAELAQLVGAKSYAEITLRDKMADTPEAVDRFLKSLHQSKKPFTQAEYDTLSELKRKQTNLEKGVQVWDYPYYTSKMHNFRAAQLFMAEPLNAYFSLGTVIQGLSRLFTKLYGVRLVPCKPSAGETWHSDVRRLDVISEDEGHIAVMYCDLFRREGKNPNPCHCTLRCSRLIDEVELEESSIDETVALGRRGKDLYQLPIIALICDIPTAINKPPLLEFHEVITLFHEMGHALHSILARTTLHNVAGTRCATDFSELPSILMEYFAKSPAVMALYARHWQTDAPLPMHLMQEQLALDSLFKHSENFTQITLSLLDQELHSAAALKPNFNSTKIYQNIENTYGILKPVPETSWQGLFTHLFGYGAMYYSYLFDMAIADRVWKDVFKADPLSREAGEKYKNEVMRWGGGRDPWLCVGKVLDRPELEKGGVTAMEEIGRWGALI